MSALFPVLTTPRHFAHLQIVHINGNQKQENDRQKQRKSSVCGHVAGCERYIKLNLKRSTANQRSTLSIVVS